MSISEGNIIKAIKFGVYAVLFLPLVVFPDLITPLFFPIHNLQSVFISDHH